MHDSLPAEKAYRILEAGPVILVSTRGTDGRTNLMTAGFHMMMQHAPPLVGVIIGPGITAIRRCQIPGNVFWLYRQPGWQRPLWTSVIAREKQTTNLRVSA